MTCTYLEVFLAEMTYFSWPFSPPMLKFQLATHCKNEKMPYNGAGNIGLPDSTYGGSRDSNCCRALCGQCSRSCCQAWAFLAFLQACNSGVPLCAEHVIFFQVFSLSIVGINWEVGWRCSGLLIFLIYLFMVFQYERNGREGGDISGNCCWPAVRKAVSRQWSWLKV